jgi:two-component system sensor histidine kinase KdpD
MQAAVLQRYTCDVVAADGLHAVVSITCQALGTLFRAPAVVLLISEGRVLSTNRFGELRLHDAELEAAQSSLTTGTVLRGGVYPHLASRFDFWPVQTTGSQNAVIGLAFDPDERPSAPDMAITVVANVLALAIECQHGRDSGSPQ